jgi:hypothetical protein
MRTPILLLALVTGSCVAAPYFYHYLLARRAEGTLPGKWLAATGMGASALCGVSLFIVAEASSWPWMPAVAAVGDCCCAAMFLSLIYRSNSYNTRKPNSL